MTSLLYDKTFRRSLRRWSIYIGLLLPKNSSNSHNLSQNRTESGPTANMASIITRLVHEDEATARQPTDEISSPQADDSKVTEDSLRTFHSHHRQPDNRVDSLIDLNNDSTELWSPQRSDLTIPDCPEELFDLDDLLRTCSYPFINANMVFSVADNDSIGTAHTFLDDEDFVDPALVFPSFTTLSQNREITG